MSKTEKAPDADDFESSSKSSIDDGTLELEPGDQEVARVTGVDLSEGFNGVVYLDGRAVGLNQTLKETLMEAAVGSWALYEKDDTKRSFTREDGTEKEFYPRTLTLKEDD